MPVFIFQYTPTLSMQACLDAALRPPGVLLPPLRGCDRAATGFAVYAKEVLINIYTTNPEPQPEFPIPTLLIEGDLNNTTNKQYICYILLLCSVTLKPRQLLATGAVHKAITP